MLSIHAEIQGDKVLISGLNKFAQEVPNAVRAGLSDVVKEAHLKAVKNLSGAGRKKARMRDKKIFTRAEGNFNISMKRRTAARGQSSDLGGRPGSYPPVPRITGHLARLEDFVLPGRMKTSNGVTFSAGKFEAVLFNSAEYAIPIHEGKGSSKKYGKRPFQTDAVKDTDVVGIIEKRLIDLKTRIF